MTKVKYTIPFIATAILISSFIGCSESKKNDDVESSGFKFLSSSTTETKASAVSSSTENAALNVSDSTTEALAKKTTAPSITLPSGAIISWLQDNETERLMPRELFSDASDSLYNSLNLPNGIPASVGTFLLNINGEYALFDAGLGSFGGQLLKQLNENGVSPENIKYIFLTHMHVDHIAGLMQTPAGKTIGNANATFSPEKVFTNAEIYLSEIEYKAWLKEISKNDLQKSIIALYQDKIHLFEFGDTLPYGISALDAKGHTPGHTAFQIENVLVIGDLMHGYALQKDHLEINSNYDMDKEKSIEARKRILAYAKQNNLTMAGMHLPPPGFAK